MKKWKFGPMPLLALMLGGGLLGFLFRMLMLKLGYDGPVQIRGHWTYILLWVLALGVPGGMFIIARGMGDNNTMEANFPASAPAGGCTILAACLMLGGCLMTLLGKSPFLSMLAAAVGAGAAVALGLHGWLRMKGQGSAGAVLAVTLYFCLRLIAGFRFWSVDPLLGDYVFRLLGTVSAMAAAYQLSGFPIGKGSRKWCLFWCGTAVFFAMMNFADGGADNLLFFAALVLWMLPGGCRLEGPPKPRRVLGGGYEVTPE